MGIFALTEINQTKLSLCWTTFFTTADTDKSPQCKRLLSVRKLCYTFDLIGKITVEIELIQSPYQQTQDIKTLNSKYIESYIKYRN